MANHCDHKNQLVRQHRSIWDKLSGIKEVYICNNCGKRIKLKESKRL